MGKKKIDKIQKIECDSQRKVTFCKRKKGVIKKAMELSILCDVSMFLYIYDKKSQRVIHYSSSERNDLMDVFNKKNHREFYTNRDYLKMGGRTGDIDVENLHNYNSPNSIPNLPDISDNVSRIESTYKFSEMVETGYKIFSMKRKETMQTS